MNKRGTKLFAFWWFIAVVSVCIVFVSLAVMYLAKPIDVRGVQSEIVQARVYGCLVDNGFLRSEVLSPNFNLTSVCKLSEKNINSSESLVFVSLKNSSREIYHFQIGDGGSKEDCLISKGTSEVNYAPCAVKDRPVFYLDNGIKQIWNLEIIVSSKNSGARV